MNHIMLDLETMGNRSTAAIAAIGAVRFNPAQRQITSEFYMRVNLASSTDAGLTLDASTVLWWLKQSDDARKEITHPGAVSLECALIEFENWLHATEAAPIIWGNGADFDNVILANAYRAAGFEQPWNHYDNRCYRTLKSLKPELKIQRTGTYHHALDDAKNQARHWFDIADATGICV